MADQNADPLIGGFYSAQDAARLLRIASVRRIKGWLAGYGGATGPILERDYEPVGGKQALSFWDLIEVRFLDYFRQQGLSLQTLRKVAIKARQDLNARHPFAVYTVRFVTDRKRIFATVAEEEKDTRAWDIATSQYEMYETIERSLAKNVEFNPSSGLAQRFFPLPDIRAVFVHPSYAYGKPVVGEMGVPTAALFRMWEAERGNKRRVADAFGVSEQDVATAVEFEMEMAAA